MTVNEIITQKIIERLERGDIPWKKPWKCPTAPKNLVSGNEYRGINSILTRMQDFSSPYWLTFKQCSDLGGKVKAGSKGTAVIFAGHKEDEDTGKDFFYIRYYTVFNTDQCEGLTVPTIETGFSHSPIENAEKIVSEYVGKPEVKHSPNRAYYSPSLDYIGIPDLNAFDRPEAYYCTLFHELGHSTGHESRVNRKFDGGFGSEPYAKEELIAELSAAFLCALAGIDQPIIENTTAYIQNWLKVLKSDPRFVISAAAQAQKAFDWILNKRPGMKPSEPVKPHVEKIILSTWKLCGQSFTIYQQGETYYLSDKTGACKLSKPESGPLDVEAVEKHTRARIRQFYANNALKIKSLEQYRYLPVTASK